MTIAEYFDRARNMLHAFGRRRADDARWSWSRDRLLDYQRTRLAAMVEWASERSPFYRELYGGRVAGPVELTELPPITKNQMMADFDRFVTDPRLRRAELERHVAAVKGDELYAGEFRVMSSSGSSGIKALYVYDRQAWREGILPGMLRASRLSGLAPRIPRPRVCSIAAPDGKHMTFRGSLSMDVGMTRSIRLSAAAPVSAQVAALQAHAPEFLIGYPSAIALLADEQRAGRLRIAPKSVITSSEVRTAAMTAAIRDAWNIQPFDLLGMTETGMTAMDCSHHAGLHVFEDLCIVEVVDERGRPVPPRTPGAKLLVTNLFNRVQPIIRFEVSDLVTLDDAPCPCGSQTMRISALDGRSDDMLELMGPRGPVRIHPIHVRSALTSDAAVVQYQVTLAESGLDVAVVLASGASLETPHALRRRLEEVITARHASVPIEVRAVTAIARESGAGKLKLVRDARQPRPIAT